METPEPDPHLLKEQRQKVEKLRLAKIERHIFLCCDPTKAKCCSRKRTLRAWKYLNKRLKELGLSRKEGVHALLARQAQLLEPFVEVLPGAECPLAAAALGLGGIAAEEDVALDLRQAELFHLLALFLQEVRIGLRRLHASSTLTLALTGPSGASWGAMGELNAQVSETATVFGRDPEWVLSFDREGRLLTFVQGRELFKRALDSRLFQRDRREGRRWKLLDDRGRREVFAAARELAGATAGAPDAPAALRERLETEVLPWTVERLLAEEERFLAAYRPIAILPPDRYLAVVLQATEGCTWNRCTFCSFYQGRPFHLASPEDFRRHAAAVQSLLGRDLARRRSIFLADGNALAV